MDPEEKREEIFAAAIEIEDRSDRDSYIEQACAKDQGLLEKVQSLLHYHDENSFLDVPALEAVTGTEISILTEDPGTVIGRYKLLEKIGEGGMAVVYMAEQEKPIHRKVALKIIKLGMDTKQVIARFEAERQALAMMDHPNIAKVLDAGATETGRPYFVMELVTGVSITEYCDKQRLSTKDRLGLFAQVCNAVQHAHQKGIIHRDVKPSNVMVTQHDGMPLPKVIDFGIAKAINQRLTEKTLFTRYAQIVGTPAYMSPEQAELSDAEVDTRTDIYSLGILLYELLTGTTPFAPETMHQAGYLEMLRLIREEQPPKPSTKLSSLGGAGTHVGTTRRTTPETLRRQLRGDLDWIVMKALEKDRNRRYDAATNLAVDVRHYLNQEPVTARPPRLSYVLKMYMRKYRVRLSVAAAMVVLLCAVMIISLMWNHSRTRLRQAAALAETATLAQAREAFAKRDLTSALQYSYSLLDSPRIGAEARLLYAGVLVEGMQFREAELELRKLLEESSEITGAAYALLARVYWEGESAKGENLTKIDAFRRKAEELLPDTADAYFLRAMTAIMIKEKLQWLSKALRTDPVHFESRRLRAYIYYASRKYVEMERDSQGMVIMRPQDPLGYTLRAIACREMGHYEEALQDIDRALELTPPDDPSLKSLQTQRLDMLLRMGRHEQVVRDGSAYLSHTPGDPQVHFYLICARTAQGDYSAARSLYQTLTNIDPELRFTLQAWSMKYVFDILHAGRSWYPTGAVPTGAVFEPMLEAAETYEHLSAKARRVIADGFTAYRSPDSAKLAFSLGFHGYSGVGLLDTTTGETDLLMTPGKDPCWSPNGQYIAFVRDCQVLRLPEFATVERKSQMRSTSDEEVWVMRHDGTEPRRLARGGWPSWSPDSKAVYYQSRIDHKLYSVSILDPVADPVPVLDCTADHCPVSPDGECTAFLESGVFKIVDLQTESSITEWTAPLHTWGGTWSPNSQEFSMGGGNRTDVRAGLWIYDRHSQTGTQVLRGQITVASWSPDQTELIFSLGPPYYEIWIADIDPSVPTVESLGPGLSVEESYQQWRDYFTQEIDNHPQVAENYLHRAQYNLLLGHHEMARADMDRYADILMPSKSARSLTDQAGSGMGKMGAAYPTFGPAINLGPVINTAHAESACCLSSDGLELYIASDRPGGQGMLDIWVAERPTIDSDWNAPTNVGTPVNTVIDDVPDCLSADGLELYISAAWPGGRGRHDIWISRRPNRNAPWSKPVNLGPLINSHAYDRGASMSGDGLRLYFSSYRPGGVALNDLYVSCRDTTDDPWNVPLNLGPWLNSPWSDMRPCSAENDCWLLISEHPQSSQYRAGGLGWGDIWMTTRTDRDHPWGPLINIGPEVNSTAYDGSPEVSGDGSMLYFCSTRPEGRGDSDIWQAPILQN